MTLVVGATGLVGSEVCRRLRAKNRLIRALVRSTSDSARVQELGQLGAELARGDLKDRASIEAACRNVTAVVSTAASTISRQPGDSIQTVERAGQLGLVEAARAAGVRHFVFVSFSGSIDGDFPLRHAKREVEESLKRSGMTYTILRPSCFMEVWLSPHVGFDPAKGRVRVFGSGAARLSWISFVDVAQFCVEALDNPAARNATIELGGPEALSPREVAAIFEGVIGRPVAIESVPEAALEAQWRDATDPLERTLAALMLAVAKGDSIDMRETLETFPVNLTSVSAWARRAVAAA